MTHYSSTMHRLPRGGRGPSPSLGRQLPFLPRSSHPSRRRSTPSLHLQFYGGDRLTQELASPETKQATSSLAECTQHSLMRLPGLYSMPETREINLSGYQFMDNWKVTKDQSSCRREMSSHAQHPSRNTVSLKHICIMDRRKHSEEYHTHEPLNMDYSFH